MLLCCCRRHRGREAGRNAQAGLPREVQPPPAPPDRQLAPAPPGAAGAQPERADANRDVCCLQSALPGKAGARDGHLLGRGRVGVVRAGAVLGGGAAGDLLRVGQRAALHLRQDALLVQRGFQEPRVAVELHQVENLLGRHGTIPSHTEPDPQAQGAGLFPEPLVSSGRVA